MPVLMYQIKNHWTFFITVYIIDLTESGKYNFIQTRFTALNKCMENPK